MASMSGITVLDEVQEFFTKDFKKDKKHAYFSCVIGPGGKGEVIKLEECDVEKLADSSMEENKKRFNEMKAGLKDAEPKFYIFDCRYETKDGRPTDKIVLISWVSDNAPIKIRMKYGATKEALKLEGVKRFHFSDLEDFDYDAIVDTLRKGS